MAGKKKVKCPNCEGDAFRIEHKGKTLIACQTERKVYELTATGYRLTDKDWFSDVEGRLAALESRGKEPQPSDDGDEDEDTSIGILFEDEE